MRSTRHWSTILGLFATFVGLGLVASSGLTVRATATISQIGADIDGEAARDESGFVAMSADGSRIAVGAPYNDGNGSDAGHVRIFTLTGGAWVQTGADIDGEAASDGFGMAVAMSADGNRVAVGAPCNNSCAGDVRVFELTMGAWTQLGADINPEAANDFSGITVAMSADGNRVAIGATNNAGNGPSAGNVRVFTLTGSAWVQTGADIDGEASGDYSGGSLAMSADGTRVAIGATNNAGNGVTAGHVRIFTLTGGAWVQTGADIDGEAAYDGSGVSVAMSADGNRVVIGAPGNDASIPASGAGHARVFTLTGGAWVQTGADIDGEAPGDQSGNAVAISADGTRVAVGAPGNSSSAGHVRIFTLTGGAWTQTGSDIDGEAAGDISGAPVKLSSDGTRVAIGATLNNDAGNDAGHLRVYEILAPTVTPTTTLAPSTTVAPTTTVGATDNSTQLDSLPATGGDAPTTVLVGLALTIAGILLTTRRRSTSTSVR